MQVFIFSDGIGYIIKLRANVAAYFTGQYSAKLRSVS